MPVARRTRRALDCRPHTDRSRMWDVHQKCKKNKTKALKVEGRLHRTLRLTTQVISPCRVSTNGPIFQGFDQNRD